MTTMPHVTINFSGAVTDRQSFLDGGRTSAIEAEDQPSAGWRMGLNLRWPVETEEVNEGDLTLVDPLGAELYATLTAGTVAEITDEEGNADAAQIDLRFEVTGGDGGYAGAAGAVHVTGTLAGQGAGTGGSFEGEAGEVALLTAEIAVEGAGEVWQHPPTENIPTGTPQRYQEPGGDEPGTTKEPER